MKKLSYVLFALFILNNSVEAGQRYQGSNNKLTNIQLKIDKYTKIIEDIPIQMQNKIDNFERLKAIGNKIEKVLTLYVKSSQDCMTKTQSPLGQEACNDLSTLDLDTTIKKKKSEVVEKIEEAERELNEVKLSEADLPIIENVLATLKATKKMLNDY